MDVLRSLKHEDDNPRGQGRSLYIDGQTLEEAQEAEERRKAINAEKISLTKQEQGILKLVQAKNYFQRLGLPEPRWDARGEPIWECGDRVLSRVYNDLKKCCHPEWSYHPRRKQGFQLLTEALDTLSNKDGKREAYVRNFVREAREKERLLKDLQRGLLEEEVPTAAANPAAEADELRKQMADKTKRMLQQSRARAKATERAAQKAAASLPAAPSKYRKPESTPSLLNDDDQEPGVQRESAVRDAKGKKKRRVGVF
uniref:J domain-containing protein n=1 Tax=Calcidiscus leptoporus TaxID=127549 RepID=A0A7S0NS62_9EUKA|mmetsp:Transcript_2221/g.4987  ORF Transcript_2221/g.4987 Transcript_2221/m.4987 type:complete len:256 (+) Transcript_2221:91-858(+)